MTEIFRCLAGSRLYGTANADSDHDYKAVHLPTKRQILLGKRDQVISRSTGSQTSQNGADDVDVESFELQRFLKLAADMQTIPVEMLFVANNDGRTPLTAISADANHRHTAIWHMITANRDKILSRNTKAFAGYCKGQAVRYSMRGKRLETYVAVCDALRKVAPLGVAIWTIAEELADIEGVKIIPKPQPGDNVIDYLDVYGRQTPMTVKAGEALKIYSKPVDEAGKRAQGAMEAGGMDCKALYHAVRIADEGISLFQTGEINFPCQNLPILRKIRAGTVEIDQILDIFAEKLSILEQVGENSPLPVKSDQDWINDFVAEVYEDIVRA
jgi:hypothetical protein